jgi:tetratricopeptide (TPR) repeat protein
VWGYLALGIDLTPRGAAAAPKRGDDETIANPELNLGDAYLVQGDLALAHELLAGVHRRVGNPKTSAWMRWRYSTHLFASLGELALARGDREDARRFADECLAIATRTNTRKYLVRGWRLRGEIDLARGKTTDAEQCLRQALGIARAIKNPPQLWATYEALGRLHAASNDADAARGAYRAARAAIDATLATLQNPRLRASLEASPLARRIAEGGRAD